MAITQKQVSDWFKLNPNATPEQVAQLVQSIGGFTKNPELATLIGNQYGMSGLNIKSIFGNLTGQTSGMLQQAPTVIALPINPRTGQPGDPFGRSQYNTVDEIIRSYVDFYGPNNAGEKNQLQALSILRNKGVSENLLQATFPTVYSDPKTPTNYSEVAGTTSIQQMKGNTASFNALEDYVNKVQATRSDYSKWFSPNDIIEYAQKNGIDPDFAKRFADQYSWATSSQVRDAFTDPRTKSADIVLKLIEKGISPETVARYTGVAPERASQIYTDSLINAESKKPRPNLNQDFGALIPKGLMQTTTAGGTTTGDTAGTNQTQTDTKQVAPSANVQKVLEVLAANPSITDKDIVSAMKQFNVSPKDIAQSFGLSEGQVISRVAATVPNGQSIQIGDTIIQPQYQVFGSGDDEQIGALESVYTYRASDNKVGGGYTQYAADGTLERTGTQMKVDATKDFVKFALGAAALFGGAALAGLSPESISSLYGSGAMVGQGLTAAEAFAAGLTPAQALAAGLTTAELTAAGYTAAQLATTGATTGLLTTTAATTTAAATAANAATAAATGLTTTQVANLVKSGLTAAQITSLFSSGATTASGLLQQQTSKEAADKARAMIEAETTAGKTAAQFKPIGMTTRFGTSQFQFDPKTGQLTSAGYTLSPEAKNAQDRFITLAGQGLTQAEGAQAQFAPLQTGAQSLFTLGNQYLAKSPEQVAADYLKSQMALLQPGRELELANLQNKLQQQGRGGLAVAQGGTLGDTTPELQALFNARAQQEALLAANAQKAGQADVTFGAGLLTQGAKTMGDYYAGQTGAYDPYKTAVGQVSALETLGQQPFTLSTGLAEKTAAAGSRVADIGLRGAGQSVALATGAAATTNPYSTLLSGVASNSAFSDLIGKTFGRTPTTPEQEAIDRYMKTFG